MSAKPSAVSATACTTAGLSTAAAAILIPQHSEAALVTVGGDGGVGSVTLFAKGDGTDIGGLLASYVAYGGTIFGPPVSFDLRLATTTGVTTVFGGPPPVLDGGLFSAVRSSSRVKVKCMKKW